MSCGIRRNGSHLCSLFLHIVGKGNTEKYIVCRALAETLRVQVYYSTTGIFDSICDSFTRTQKQDSAWIKNAVSALLIGEENTDAVPPDLLENTPDFNI